MAFTFIALSGLTFARFNEIWNVWGKRHRRVDFWAKANVIASERVPFYLFAVIKLSV